MLIKRNSSGFTLIELLIVISIVVMVGAAILSIFAGGINIYKHVKEFGAEETQAFLSLEEAERDLRNTFVMAGIDFVGQEKEVVFAGLVNTADPKDAPNLSPGRIRYYFDDKLKCLVREDKGYAYALSEIPDFKPAAKNLAYLRNVTFSYYYLNPQTGQYEWQTSFSANGGLPLAVGVETEFLNGTKTIKANRIVLIPVAG